MNILYCVGDLFNHFDQQLEGRFPMPGTHVYTTPHTHTHTMHVCVYIPHNFTHTLSICVYTTQIHTRHACMYTPHKFTLTHMHTEPHTHPSMCVYTTHIQTHTKHVCPYHTNSHWHTCTYNHTHKHVCIYHTHTNTHKACVHTPHTLTQPLQNQRKSVLFFDKLYFKSKCNSSISLNCNYIKLPPLNKFLWM